jgi:PPP family 3-phenylpropionic acid transporter
LAARGAEGSVHPVTLASRHAALYAAQFFAFGVMLPFLPVVLASRGLDAAEVAAVLAAGSAVRLVAGPLGGRVADVALSARGVLLAGALASALAVLGFHLAAGFAAALAVHLLLSAAMAPVVPLSDALCIAASRREGFDYGRVRAWGSIAFILAALLGGQAVAGLGAGAAVGLVAAGFLATAVTAALLPRDGVASRRGAGGLAGFAEPFRVPAFRLLVVLSALMHGSHAFYYAFGTLHWQAAGLGAGLIGALWAAGVVAEIALFIWGRGVVARLGPVGLSLLAAGAGALRWAVTAATVDPLLLFPAQLLHAATFGAQHLATMAVLGRVAPGAGAGTAQTVHAALGPGLAMGLLTLACGPLYAAFGGGGFWAMALLCAAAAPVALMLGRALRPPP